MTSQQETAMIPYHFSQATRISLSDAASGAARAMFDARLKPAAGGIARRKGRR